MSNRNDRHSRRDEWRDQDRHQMGQYADSQRQYGGQRYLGHEPPDRDARNWGSQREQEDFARRDPVQASYGRASAPDLHGRPSGGYQRDWRADSGYNEPGYAQDPGYQGYQGYQGQQGYGGRDARDSWRSQGGYNEGRDWDRGGHGRFQGGSGGYRSNAGPYAGSQTYGGYGDQLGYGSYQDRSQQHHDPDYQQWREQQLRNLDDEYQSWRGERYKKFSDEFDSWRKNRQSQQASKADASASNAKPGGDSK